MRMTVGDHPGDGALATGGGDPTAPAGPLPLVAAVERLLDLRVDARQLSRKEAQARTIAVSRMCSVAPAQHRNSARWVIEHLAELAEAYGSGRSLSSSTLKTYASRAHSTLTQLEPELSSPTAVAKAIEPVLLSAPPPSRDQSYRHFGPLGLGSRFSDALAAPRPPERELPLPGGGTFFFRPPPQGLKLADVQRIAVHLATLASDFDPSRQAADLLAPRKEADVDEKKLPHAAQFPAYEGHQYR